MAMINVNGVDLPSPLPFKLPHIDLDSQDTGRNELGYMQRDRVRHDVFSLELEWKYLSSEQLQTILTAIEPAQFTVKFPSYKGELTKTMYAGNRQIQMVTYNDDYNKIKWDLSCPFIEF